MLLFRSQSAEVLAHTIETAREQLVSILSASSYFPNDLSTWMIRLSLQTCPTKYQQWIT